MGLLCMAMVMTRDVSKLIVTEVVRTVVVGMFVSTIRQVTVICTRWRRRGCDGTMATLPVMSKVHCRSRMMMLIVGSRRVIFIDG